MNTDLRILAQQLGEVQGRLKAAEEALREQGQDIKAILNTLNQARGGWNVVAGGRDVGRLRGVGDQGIDHHWSTAEMKRPIIPF